jgi:DNA-binding NarL/FixJ family response regulator
MVVGPPPTRLRIVEALAAHSDVSTHSAASMPDSMDCEAGSYQLLVVCCERASTKEVAVFKQFKCESPGLLIVAACGSIAPRAVRRLLDGGVDGLVFFDQLDVSLAPTVAAVFAGQMVVPRNLRASVHKPALSSRERQILGMVVPGLTNHEIGTRLFLAESTVKSHLSSAYDKLGVSSRGEAVAMIMDRSGPLGPEVVARAPDAGLRAA